MVHVLEYCAPSLNVSEEPEYLAVIIAWDSRAAEHVADNPEASGYEDAFQAPRANDQPEKVKNGSRDLPCPLRTHSKMFDGV